jgi:hypothetical protein
VDLGAAGGDVVEGGCCWEGEEGGGATEGVDLGGLRLGEFGG